MNKNRSFKAQYFTAQSIDDKTGKPFCPEPFMVTVDGGIGDHPGQWRTSEAQGIVFDEICEDIDCMAELEKCVSMLRSAKDSHDALEAPLKKVFISVLDMVLAEGLMGEIGISLLRTTTMMMDVQALHEEVLQICETTPEEEAMHAELQKYNITKTPEWLENINYLTLTTDQEVIHVTSTAPMSETQFKFPATLLVKVFELLDQRQLDQLGIKLLREKRGAE